nr:MAG TPA: hypothetical protein [Caudoviricetes sp.]
MATASVRLSSIKNNHSKGSFLILYFIKNRG